MDAHDVLETKAGNATCLNEFSPVIEVPKKKISLKFCYGCYTHWNYVVNVGDYAMYLEGILQSHPI